MPRARMSARFDRTEGELLYVQVSDFVREKIYSKDWGVNEPIPSEHELMGMLDLSRGTVQKGIRQLVDEGLLVQQRGRGTFVVQPVMARPSSNRLLSFGESMSSQGIDYETRVVEKSVRTANDACAENLQIAPGDGYLYLCRVRYVRRRAVMFIESHLNLSVCPGLAEVDFEAEALFAAVERTSGRGIGRSEMVYTARVAGKERGRYLECDEHAPVLELDQLVRLDDGTPFEWGSVWLPANRCVISSETRRG
ncbi:GntR family transcriptional regulator [Olsenella urininfantis]|uniref:GntR family transcriptional regulator n=1 Tax=Olsenella urininfantis TaxID=1871033 RepID=UPI001F18E451|nr:GntR family transcriptional regulator [Olsenella urininfantis]